MNSTAVNVYSIDKMPMEDRMDVYSNEMLPGVRCSFVQSAIVSYVTENIEPVGWRAIWRSTPQSSGLDRLLDFVVEVLDVSQVKLETTAELIATVESFTNDVDQVKNNAVEHAEDVASLLQKHIVSVPLMELYPIPDDSMDSQFMRTAEIVEHIRFFYKYLWFPWDVEDEENCVFVNRYLEPRIKLYYDIARGILPSPIAKRYHSSLTEARIIQYRLDKLEDEMDVSDSEVEFNEKDIMTCMELSKKLEELRRDFQYLENPALRSLMIKQELPVKPTPLGKRENDEVVVHVVTDKLLAGMLRDVAFDTVVVHHTSFGAAIAAAYEGDSVWVFPGVYVCDTIGWLDDSITVKGKGKSPEDVVIEATDSGDIFFNCAAPCVHLENLTIKGDPSQQCTVMVHSGSTTLHKCHVVGGQVSAAVCSSAEINLTSCFIHNAKGCGISIRASASALVRDCVIDTCGHFPIVVEKKDDSMEMSNVKLIDNKCDLADKCDIVKYIAGADLRDLMNIEHESENMI